MLYPPNSSSEPSPDKAKSTCFFASLPTKYNGTQDGSASGSSKCHIISGNFSTYSSGEIVYEIFSNCSASAVSSASPTSENPSIAQPTEKVFISGFNCFAKDTTNVESIPPDKKEPICISPCICFWTDSNIVS